MLKRFVLSLAVAVTLGQGCLWTPPTYTTSTVTPSGEPSPEGPVAFREGFGKLPDAAPWPSLPPGPRPSIVLGAELPKIPPDVTVLRERSAAPDETILQNIALAVRIPAEMLGRSPQGTSMALGWRDDRGYRWSYDASSNRMSFDQRPVELKTATDVMRTDEQLIQNVKAFLDAHGVLMRGWGNPEVVPDGSSRTVVFAANRDEQLVLDDKGESVFAARIAIDAETGDVTHGWFELPSEVDRSNYPAIAASDVLERLRAGGLNPIEGSSPAVTISLDSFVLALYRHTTAADEQSRSYYLPALWARGKVRRANGSTTGYATVVPLVRDEAFSD